MRKEYRNPEMTVTEFAAENIVTISGTKNLTPDALKNDSNYVTKEYSITELVSFSN